MYAAKHVTLVGMDKLSPDVVMQSLAAVYGLRVGRRDGTAVLTAPLPSPSSAFTEVKRALLRAIPAPIYRAFRLRSRPASGADMPSGSPGSPAPALSLDDYEAHGVAVHNSVLRLFRYLAEPQVKPPFGAARTLSRLGKRASDLFELSRMVRAYTGLCGLADCSPPPYLTDLTEFADHVLLHGSPDGNENTLTRVTLSFIYSNPKTGVKYGPVEFFDSTLPRTSREHP